MNKELIGPRQIGVFGVLVVPANTAIASGFFFESGKPKKYHDP